MCSSGGFGCSQCGDGPVGQWSSSFDCRTTVDIRRDEGVELMTLVGDVSRLGCPDFHLVYVLC